MQIKDKIMKKVKKQSKVKNQSQIDTEIGKKYSMQLKF